MYGFLSYKWVFVLLLLNTEFGKIKQIINIAFARLNSQNIQIN